IKSLVQAKARVQHGRSKDRTCRVSVSLKYGRQCGLAWIQLVAAEIVHAAEHGVRSGEDDRVRWERDWHGSVCALEARAIGSERIDVGSANLLIAVASQVVSTQSVDGDYDDVRRRLRLGRQLAANE